MFHGVIQKITLAQFFWDMVYNTVHMKCIWCKRRYWLFPSTKLYGGRLLMTRCICTGFSNIRPGIYAGWQITRLLTTRLRNIMTYFFIVISIIIFLTHIFIIRFNICSVLILLFLHIQIIRDLPLITQEFPLITREFCNHSFWFISYLNE